MRTDFEMDISLRDIQIISFITLSVTGQNDYLQSFGKSAICVKHIGTWTYQDRQYTYYLDPLITGTCHKYICNEKKLLVIDFRGSLVQCPRNGGMRKFSIMNGSKRHNGTIICPQANRFC
ncbi:hypothetical protein EWB00_010569 [Schistosoma japonicum]|uniref:Uncharacterized protein n=1 Tax=Schistosoma japonicum TaxID=6182 RepID=A0A4Z2DNN0_SCHJA|nr:hypothetical protein EWB00_010569 [Schistosoma japonicum]